jgi:DNA-binding SARP family transcriptional activator
MSTAPVVVCLLGGFRLIRDGRAVPMHPGGKGEVLLSNLALAPRHRLSRDQVLAVLWPRSDSVLAGQSLNTLVYTLHRLVGDALRGAPPILHEEGDYRLNHGAGVVVDIERFDAAADAGERHARSGDPSAARVSFHEAVRLYAGDLELGSDVSHLIERERLRARFLALKARLADDSYACGDLHAAMSEALQILARDPCREDAYRMTMRCYLGLGQRTQALRQYQLCKVALAREFDAPPEPATEALYELIRSDPDRVPRPPAGPG